MHNILAASAVAAASAALPPPPRDFLPGVHDVGFVMPFGGAPGAAPCPGDCDALGARDVWVWHDAQDAQWPYKMTYDGSGPTGWLACLAVSNDPTLRNWTKLGAVLKLGAPGSVDGKSASYLTTFMLGDGSWLGWYLGTNQTSPPPGDVPIGPYFTLLASAPTSSGPWTQYSSRGNVIGSGSPGVVMANPNDPGEWWQFCTGCAGGSIGLATTRNLTGTWTETKALITDAAVENTSLYFEESNGLWFLFTNQIDADAGGMAFDAHIVVYWSRDLLNWPPANKATVLNRTNAVEPLVRAGRVGLPSVMRVPGNSKQLALVYDGGGTRDDVSYNENCSVALAWLDLPLTPPPAQSAAMAAPPPALPLPLRYNSSLLARTWELIRLNDSRVMPALSAALTSARAQLSSGPWSVTTKAMPAPSGDAHDYASIGVYWWPCTQSVAVCNISAKSCNASTGMPWVSCDGHFDSKAVAEGDQPSVAALSAAVGALATGFYFSRDEAFAERAVELVEAWFLAPATAMNPNLDFGQRFPGEQGYSNGSFSGLIEVDSAWSTILDALSLLALPAPCQGPPPAAPCAPSGAWTAALNDALLAWLRAWSAWMEGPFGAQACSFFNNHQIYCRLQWTHVSAWLGAFDRAAALLNGAKEGPTAPVGAQIWRDGELHNEEARVNSVGYVGMALQGLLWLGQAARFPALVAAEGPDAVGDLYTYVSRQNESSILGAVEWLVPFARGERPWPFPSETSGFAALAPCLRQAAHAYGNASLYAVASGIANASLADASLLFWPPPAD